MAAFEAWEAQDMAASRAAGHDRDEEENEEQDEEQDEADRAVWKQLWDLQTEIAATPATTLDGLMVKAHAAAYECRREHSPNGRNMPTDLDTALERAGRNQDDAVMALAVVRDLIRLAPTAA